MYNYTVRAPSGKPLGIISLETTELVEELIKGLRFSLSVEADTSKNPIEYKNLVLMAESVVPDMEVQTRNKDSVLMFFKTIKEAFDHSELQDRTVWKISWTDSA